MALQPVGRLENIHLSIDQYISNTLSAFSAGLVHLHGTYKFNPPASGAWIRLHYDLISQNRKFYRQAGRAGATSNQFATEVAGTIDVTIAEHVRNWTGRNTLFSARDDVVSAFPEGNFIPVKDIASTVSTTEIGQILIDGITDRLIDSGEDSGLIQWSVGVQVRYLELFTK